MSEFIKLDIDQKSCLGIQRCGKCIQVCPVNLFVANKHYPIIVEDDEDECTLCSLCLQGCEVDAITIHKLYEA